MDDDSPTLAEKMNRGMYLDPAFTQDKPNLVGALRDDIDATMARAQANVDQQRQNASDVELISKELAREAHRKELEAQEAAGAEPAESTDQP
jgi:hypothetical protein